MNYYIMVGEGPYPAQVIDKAPRLPGGPWYTGKPVRCDIPNPMEYHLKNMKGYYEQSELNLKMLYNGQSRPIMHNSLLEALRAAGADNLEVFPAHLKEPDTGLLHKDYWTFNVLGLISAADMKGSTIAPNTQSDSLITIFDSLAIDESKTKGLHLFRLAEKCSAIIVSEQVRDEVKRRGIPGIIFYKPEYWAG